MAAALLALAPARAEEVAGRWRASLSFGTTDTRDEIRSASANVLALVDAEGNEVDRFVDPRTDTAVDGTLAIEPGGVGTLAVQYALTRTLVIEAAMGYRETEVGRIDVRTFGRFERLEAGRLTSIPLELSAVVRFRPQAGFNPYFGGGFGYSFYGFDPSAAFDTLSERLDASQGVQALLHTESVGSYLTLPSPLLPEPLAGASVDVPDSFQWQVVGGAELAFARHWSLVLDLRYARASRTMRIQFNDQDELGRSVPQGRVPLDSPLATAVYGPAWITSGGLIDGDNNGMLDTGAYWVQGGTLRYDGLAAQLGVRRTF